MAAPLSSSPPFFLDAPPRAVLQLNGSGPNTDRQQSSHPHDVVTVPGRTEILVPDLGADRTWRLAYDEEGSALSVQGSVEYPSGSGPRHAVVQGQSTLSATWKSRTRDAYVYAHTAHRGHLVHRQRTHEYPHHAQLTAPPSLGHTPQYDVDSPAPIRRSPRRPRARRAVACTCAQCEHAQRQAQRQQQQT